MKKILNIVLVLLFAANFYGQNTYVFFGSYNKDASKDGIFVYELNKKSGKLSKITSAKGMLNPSFITLSSNGKYIFACTDTRVKNDGSVSSFEFNTENKTLNFINKEKTGGENPVYLTAHKNGKWLVNANYTDSSISVYPISEDGNISPFVQHLKFSEGSINPDRQEHSHVHSTVFSPDFNYLFSPDLGSDKVRIFKFDQDNKEPLVPLEEPSIEIKSGSGPRHLTFHPNGKFAYLINELSGTIEVFSYSNGKLKSLQTIITHTEKNEEDIQSADIHLSPDGKFIYASNRGTENNIGIFSVSEDGTLKNIGYQSIFAKHSRTFAIDQSGEFLIVANSVSNNVTVFKRDFKTGLLKKVGRKTKIDGVSSVQIRNY